VKYSGKSFVISTHVFATGPAQDLKEFLLKEGADKVLFIGHPLFHDKRLKGSGYEYYEKGEKVKEYYQKLPGRKVNLLDYLFHTLRSVWWILKSGMKFDLYVGSDDVNATAGVILKKLGRVKKTVYYVIDYNPHRFKNKIMNSLYHKADRFCVKNSDETWNLSPRMEQARKDYFGFSGGHQKVVPVGVWLDRIKPKPYDEVEKHTAVFMGHITKKQGIQHVIEAIPEILKQIPDFKLLVIGDGDYLDELKKLASSLGVASFISFSGYIEDASLVEDMITRCAVALALYDLYDDDGNLTFTYYADPSKIKVYLSCGLLVLTSDYILELAPYKDTNVLLGVSDSNNFAGTLIKLMSSDMNYLRTGALDLSKEYAWQKLFSSALSGLI